MPRSLLVCQIALLAGIALSGAHAEEAKKAPPPCPPTTGQSGQERLEGRPAAAAERSAILPSAPATGPETQSAAGTVQRDGQPVPSQIECPRGPEHPNAPR
jgi:hypothetical protein